jgi:thiamine-phosphate pyrophosphorylase
MRASLLVLTDRHLAAKPLLGIVDAALAGGASTIVFREKDLPRHERRVLGERVAELVHGREAQLIVASDVDLAKSLEAHAVHLAVSDTATSALPFGRSCHNRRELRLAAEEGAMYATLSPIFVTASKPGYGPALGVRVLQNPPLPTYALGGINEGNAPECVAVGATGVAVMGSVMASADPLAPVRALLRALA